MGFSCMDARPPGLKRLQGLFGCLDLVDTACRFRAGAMIEKKPTVASVTRTTIGFLAVLAVCTAFCGLLCIDIPKRLLLPSVRLLDGLHVHFK